MLHPTLAALARIQDNAQEATGAATTTTGAGTEGQAAPPASIFDSFGSFVPLIAIFAIMYFVLIGPERKQRKKREEMLKALKKGDKVVTSGGLHGSIAAITDTTVTLQVDEGVRLKFNRAAIADVASDDAAPAKEASASASK